MNISTLLKIMYYHFSNSCCNLTLLFIGFDQQFQEIEVGRDDEEQKLGRQSGSSTASLHITSVGGFLFHFSIILYCFVKNERLSMIYQS